MQTLKHINQPSTWHFYDTGSSNIALYRMLSLDHGGDVHDAFGPHRVLFLFHSLTGIQSLNISGNQYRFDSGNVYCICLPPFSILKGSVKGSFEAFILIEKEEKQSAIPIPEVYRLSADHKKTIKAPRIAYKFLNEFDRNLIIKQRPISINKKPHILAKKIKKEIDLSYDENTKLSGFAKKLRTNEAQLSRAFKEAFDMTPLKYRNLIRVTTASFEILNGKPVLEACYNSGFQDVSRFYKQFKALTTITPAKLK